MVEFVLAMPILAFMLAMTFFFGWAVMHKQQVVVGDRYAAWRRIDTGAWPSEDALNNVVFNDKAKQVLLDGQRGLTQTAGDLIDQASQRSAQSGDLADGLLRGRTDHFPPGRAADLRASFDAGQVVWDELIAKAGGSDFIRHRHSREGLTWRRDENADCWDTLRDKYYADFDAAMEHMQVPANRMANMIRGLYLAHW